MGRPGPWDRSRRGGVTRFPARPRPPARSGAPRVALLAAVPLAFLIGFIGVWRGAGNETRPVPVAASGGEVRVVGPTASPSAASGAAAGAAPSSARATSGALLGRASVIDGDTIRVAGESVRFNGIDAPESRQTCTDERGSSYRCGAAAARALDEYLAASRPVRCNFLSRDQYGRVVGDCFRADGDNVAAWLVRNGHALDWPRFSKGRYASQQSAARRDKLGVWRGAFQNPWDWRATHR